MGEAQMHKCMPTAVPDTTCLLCTPGAISGVCFFPVHEIGPDVADELRVFSRSEASRTGAKTGAQKGMRGWDVRQWSINQHGEQGQERSTSMASMSRELGTCQERGHRESSEHVQSRGI